MITPNEIKTILDDEDPRHIEDLAQKSLKITQQYFGRTISLYAPVYLSNYCSSHCTYCGFHSHNRIKRVKLKTEQMESEFAHVAKTGIQNVLLLTGESYKATPLTYLKDAVLIAKNYFPSISLEVHPMEEAEYLELFLSGVDGVTVYQETYDRGRYKNVHISGQKKDYDYRRATPERIARSGIRQISMGILLGLSEVSNDLFELYQHLRWMEKNFPGVEYSVSFPRLRTIKGMDFQEDHLQQSPASDFQPLKTAYLPQGEPNNVSDTVFLKIICLTRILFARVGINLSTREHPKLRDALLPLGITRMSAASNTSVGGYTLLSKDDQSPQFDIQDERSVETIVQLLKKNHFDPIFTDWRRIPNEVV